ncbi:hypothetical protein B0H11DRAFT_2227826 [Mycena galericulata]|nr:hypothetical protein B0H11DRAFT_2227826 [Mycena galericulata]
MSIAQLTLPMFIGTILNWALFGTLVVQTYIYFLAFPQDSRWSKLLVVTVLVLEVIETLSNAQDMVHIFGVGWGNMEVLDDVGWAWFSVPVVAPIISSVGQIFYARRLHIIGHNAYVSVLVILISLFQLGTGIWTGVKICIAGKFSLLQSDNLIPTVTWLAATSLCDLIIVFAIIFYLLRSRKPEFQRTNSIISRIVVLTVETGVLCAIWTLVDLYLFAKFKGINYYLALCIELSKIYSNSILVQMLNWRAHIGHRHAPTTESNVQLAGIVFKTTTVPPASPLLQLSHNTESTVSQQPDCEPDKKDQLPV